MASIDEAYLDLTGTERLHGPPLLAAHKLHQKMKTDTQLNCSIGIGTSRLIAKVCSGKAKPHGVLFAVPGQEAKLLAPLDVRDIPGVGKVTEQRLQTLGVRTVGDLTRLEERFLEEHLGKWGLALAGKARGEDAGGWFDGVIGEMEAAKSISHEHTYDQDTASVEQIESTLMRLSEMVGRRLREQQFHARTLQLKLRYKDFTTVTRARTLDTPTHLDNEIYHQIHSLFHANWRRGAEVRLLGVQASGFGDSPSQGNLLEDHGREKWQNALLAADRLRDRYGEKSVTLGTGMKGGFRERTHENPAALSGKTKPPEPRG
jgi:DNA polymerase-4